MPYGLSAAAIGALFPFHFVVDGELRIRQTGPSLSLLAPSLALGDPMEQHFVVERPEGARPPVDARGRAEALYMLRAVYNDTRLRGEWVVLEGAAMFVGSPWVVELPELSRAGLSLRNFARHDAISDYLVLLETQQMALGDAEQLQQELRRHKASLQELVDARTEALVHEMDKVARSERALARQKELLQGVFDKIPVMLAVLDPQGELQLVNRELVRVLGWDLEQWRSSQTFRIMLPKSEDRARFRALIHRAPQPWEELVLTRSDGSTLATAWCTVTFVDGTVCIGQDVTMRRQAEQLQQQVAKAEHLAGIGQLAAGIAHEVNNPASYVLSNLEVLQVDLAEIARTLPQVWPGVSLAEGEAVGDRIDEMEQMVRECLDGMFRIRKIVRDLSSFSRFRQEEIERVDLGEVVESACRLVNHEIRHRARLVKRIGALPRIAGDRGKLVQMLVNLLVNAAHAIEAGDAEHHEVVVSAAMPDDDTIHLTVADTGRGIEPELLERVFEPFFTTKARGVGTGLGLSLCAQIAQMHGATLSVESTLGQGTSVRVTIPRDTGLEPGSEAEDPVEAPPVGTGARVLLVDDEPAILQAYRRILEPDHRVTAAESGREALAYLLGPDGDAFDVILCDLMMPDIDGPMVYAEVGERAPHLLSRFVFFSGGGFSTRARALVSVVPNVVLDKPIERQVLRSVVAELVAARGE